ncbi:hypothetical protein BJY01DRAFT_223678 [Aspergillus pseudoustus]|uniref:Zn(2)-C6 fungal-type domain-containing protein n=1 Tax=Aspergillus pseudoustus TaxID=1810923 RepID=A0ABR4J5Z2_9EURO
MSIQSSSGGTQCQTRRRSRYGCRNCKLRKLKCDEGKPECKKCRSFGVVCNFISNTPDLHPITAFKRQQPLTAAWATAPRPSLTDAVWTADASTFYKLNARCQDFITRYLGRSLLTPNDENMKQVNRKLLELAFEYPFLMHASLAVAFTYDRHLNNLKDSRRSLEECYHWSRSTALLNKRLQKPIQEQDKDPIWGTAAALVILTFSSPDTHTLEGAWPLNAFADSSELDWLRMNECKMALWNILDPLRSNSIFRVMAPTYAVMNTRLPEAGIDEIPSPLAAVCKLTDSSNPTTNPYFYAAHALSVVLSLSDSAVTTGPTQLFLQTINRGFKQLLLERNPVALLLLYLWYRKVGRCLWWIELRARVECPAICVYLRRYHGDNADVLAFLPGGALAGQFD